MAQWEENKHPRDEDGKFTSGGGSQSGTPAEYKRLQEMGIEPDGIDFNGMFEQNRLSIDEDGFYILNQDKFDKILKKRDAIFSESLINLEAQYSENDFYRLKIALDNYTSSNYKIINGLMRGEKIDEQLKDHFSKSIDRIHDAIEKYDNPRQIKVFRNVDINAFKGYNENKLNIESLVGYKYCDSAFSSCSLDKDTAKIFAQKNKETTGNYQIILEINVPKGKGKGMPVWKYSNYATEQEFLINSNATIKLTNVTKEDGYYLIKGDME